MKRCPFPTVRAPCSDNGRGSDEGKSGGSGDDLFQFVTGDGNDLITDFQTGFGIGDVLDFSNDATITDLDDLNIVEEGPGVVAINYGSTDRITLLGVDINELNADEFLF